MKLSNLTKGRVVINKLNIAESFFERLKGFMFKPKIEEDEGLLIKGCNSIHMFFMKFPIDVIFLKTTSKTCNKSGSSVIGKSKYIYKVVRIIENIKPWRISPYVSAADSVLEIKSRTSGNSISLDDELEVV